MLPRPLVQLVVVNIHLGIDRGAVSGMDGGGGHDEQRQRSGGHDYAPFTFAGRVLSA